MCCRPATPPPDSGTSSPKTSWSPPWRSGATPRTFAASSCSPEFSSQSSGSSWTCRPRLRLSQQGEGGAPRERGRPRRRGPAAARGRGDRGPCRWRCDLDSVRAISRMSWRISRGSWGRENHGQPHGSWTRTRGIVESEGGGIEIRAESGGPGGAVGLGGARRWCGAGLA